MDVNAYYALGVPAYLLVIALEVWLGRRKGFSDYGLADAIGNLSAGMGEVLVGLFLGPYLIGIYDWAHANLALIHWSKGSVIPWILAFFVGDLGYYIYHRAGHRIALFWAIHGVHHQSERFNVTIAIRHPWLSDTYAAIFYAPLPLLGVTSTQFFLAISIISFYSLTIHTRIFRRPGFFLLTTPDTHIVHHARNPRYIGKNLGAMFTLWDRLFGTHVEVVPEDPPELGARVGYQTHDGALAQWIFLRDLFSLVRQTPRFSDKLRTLFGRPGWIPPGASLQKRPPARAEEAIPVATRAYVTAHFSLASMLAVYLLWFRSWHPLWLQISLFLVLVHTLSSLGGLLDGRPGARAQELRRLGLWAATGVALLFFPAQAALGACLFGAALLGLLWFSRSSLVAAASAGLALALLPVRADAQEPEPPAPREAASERWCAPELAMLDGDVCWAEPKKRADGPRTLVIFLHGVIQPDSGWQYNQQRAALRAAEVHGFSVLMPRGRRGNGPKTMEDWWTWPTGAAHASVEEEVIREWARARAEIEKNSVPFERVWIFGFSNGAYFATSLAIRARLSPGREIKADGFAVFAGGDGAPYLEKSAKTQPLRAPLFVGWGGRDKAHKEQIRLARMLGRLRWPSRSAGAPRAGHVMLDKHVEEAVQFLASARVQKVEARKPDARGKAPPRPRGKRR